MDAPTQDVPPPRTTVSHLAATDPVAREAYSAAFRLIRNARPLPSTEYPVDEPLWRYQVAQARREGVIR